jgi:hypothetical protein
MNDPDNFLSRWSRRKREAGESKETKDEAAGVARTEPAPETEPGSAASVPDAAPTPKFDAEDLPPIESISAETDITAFMRAGVPETLKRAALRRAWSSDPDIRDFVGLNENYWDAAGPGGIAGFGDLDPNLDVKRMVSELFGEAPRQEVAEADSPAKPTEYASPSLAEKPGEPDRPPATAAALTPAKDVPQRTENAATQKESLESGPAKKIARRHGGAMPQ